MKCVKAVCLVRRPMGESASTRFPLSNMSILLERRLSTWLIESLTKVVYVTCSIPLLVFPQGDPQERLYIGLVEDFRKQGSSVAEVKLAQH